MFHVMKAALMRFKIRQSLILLALSLPGACSLSSESELSREVGCYGVALPDSLAHSFAGDRQWFTGNNPILFRGEKYFRFGMVRPSEILHDPATPNGLVLAGSYDGVPVFTDREEGEPPRVVFVPVDEACQYLAYATAEEIR